MGDVVRLDVGGGITLRPFGGRSVTRSLVGVRGRVDPGVGALHGARVVATFQARRAQPAGRREKERGGRKGQSRQGCASRSHRPETMKATAVRVEAIYRLARARRLRVTRAPPATSPSIIRPPAPGPAPGALVTEHPTLVVESTVAPVPWTVMGDEV